MITIDLITGFLGSGKTTFIRNYIQYLVAKGENICILENDHGAINIDALVLEDLEGPLCDVEMIIGGDGAEAHQRRFRTKLISLGMLGYDRVIVEPSGIYDVDEFFDTLREDPLPKWYTPGSVISLVDGRENIAALPKEASAILASQAAVSGKILLTHMDTSSYSADQVTDMLQEAVTGIKCGRQIRDAVIAANPGQLTDELLSSVSSCGYVNADYEKLSFLSEEFFQSIFYMHVTDTYETASQKIQKLFSDPSFGTIRRVKGFLPNGDEWIQINATPDQIDITKTTEGQAVMIIIGDHLNKDKTDALWPEATTV